jgi:hypothetical protein
MKGQERNSKKETIGCENQISRKRGAGVKSFYGEKSVIFGNSFREFGM